MKLASEMVIDAVVPGDRLRDEIRARFERYDGQARAAAAEEAHRPAGVTRHAPDDVEATATGVVSPRWSVAAARVGGARAARSRRGRTGRCPTARRSCGCSGPRATDAFAVPGAASREIRARVVLPPGVRASDVGLARARPGLRAALAARPRHSSPSPTRTRTCPSRSRRRCTRCSTTPSAYVVARPGDRRGPRRDAACSWASPTPGST